MLGILIWILPQEETPMDSLIALPLLILGITWCFVDADERGFHIGGFTKLLLVFCFLLGFPVYVFRSAGVRFKTLAMSLVLATAMGAVFCVSASVSFLVGDWLGFLD